MMPVLSGFCREGDIMPGRKANPASFLKSRDPATLPKRGGRAASTFYPELVKAFLEKGEKAMDVDVAKLGRKPETVRSALAKAVKQAGAQDSVSVSKFGDEVVLVRR
jgi:hypothetical protein